MWFELPHRRWNPLQNGWVLVSPQRSIRPWKGEVYKAQTGAVSSHPYSSECYLCPGNSRAKGKKNPAYESVFTFDNDFPALMPKGLEPDFSTQLVRAKAAGGVCRVICYHPNHSASLASMDKKEVKKVIAEWGLQYKELSSLKNISHIMIFENKGEMMGASNPHPHGQIWASDEIPEIPRRSAENQKAYFRQNKTNLLLDYLKYESSTYERIIIENDQWSVVVPFWAVWPYETLVIPKRAVSKVPDLTEDEIGSWAEVIQQLIRTYDRLFNCIFPYSMGLYQLPSSGDWPGFVLHQSFFPPLLRSANVKKHMVGYELCAEPQRDITPEQAAANLKQHL